MIVFVVVCITGPVLGIIAGGAIVQKFAGGYEGKHSITISLIFALCAFASSLPINVATTIEEYGACLWAVLFFGGAVIPNVQGIMISSLDNQLRAAGNSVSNILQNLLGFLPAPFVYGIIFQNTKDTNPRCAMMVTLMYSLVGVGFIAAAMYYRSKNWAKMPLKNEAADVRQMEVIDFEEGKENKKLSARSKPSMKTGVIILS